MNAVIEYHLDAPLDDTALNGLFARASPDHEVRNYERVLAKNLGIVTAYLGGQLIGFVNLATDGGERAFLLDPTVDITHRRPRIGTELVRRAVSLARERNCKWLHVDYDAALAPFYHAAGFCDSTGGVRRLTAPPNER